MQLREEAAWQKLIESGDPERVAEAAFNFGFLLERRESFKGARAANQKAIDGRHLDHSPAAAFNLGVLLARRVTSAERVRLTSR